MANKRRAPREFVLISKPPPQIDAQEFPEFYTLYQQEIFKSLERRGLISAAQRDAALVALDGIPRMDSRS
ncbi:MAG: hypothetical protein FWC90_02335 [Oscillospiraceae bacterium]|nr:hypothetical protein [Oscillospiraceae bacterium]